MKFQSQSFLKNKTLIFKTDKKMEMPNNFSIFNRCLCLFFCLRLPNIFVKIVFFNFPWKYILKLHYLYSKSTMIRELLRFFLIGQTVNEFEISKTDNNDSSIPYLSKHNWYSNHTKEAQFFNRRASNFWLYDSYQGLFGLITVTK